MFFGFFCDPKLEKTKFCNFFEFFSSSSKIFDQKIDRILLGDSFYTENGQILPYFKTKALNFLCKKLRYRRLDQLTASKKPWKYSKMKGNYRKIKGKLSKKHSEKRCAATRSDAQRRAAAKKNEKSVDSISSRLEESPRTKDRDCGTGIWSQGGAHFIQTRVENISENKPSAQKLWLENFIFLIYKN